MFSVVSLFFFWSLKQKLFDRIDRIDCIDRVDLIGRWKVNMFGFLAAWLVGVGIRRCNDADSPAGGQRSDWLSL